MLKGERAEAYLAPGGQRMRVCELCTDRAFASGWIRESAHAELPASARRHEPRRSLLTRFRRRLEERNAQPPATAGDQADGNSADGGSPGEPPAEWATTEQHEGAAELPVLRGRERTAKVIVTGAGPLIEWVQAGAATICL